MKQLLQLRLIYTQPKLCSSRNINKVSSLIDETGQNQNHRSVTTNKAKYVGSIVKPCCPSVLRLNFVSRNHGLLLLAAAAAAAAVGPNGVQMRKYSGDKSGNQGPSDTTQKPPDDSGPKVSDTSKSIYGTSDSISSSPDGGHVSSVDHSWRYEELKDLRKSKFSSTNAFSRSKEEFTVAEGRSLEKDPRVRDIERVRRRQTEEDLGGIYATEKFQQLRYWSIQLSILTFAIYFFLREATDEDLDWEAPLWRRVPWMEIQRLNELIVIAKVRGEPTIEFEKRLKQLERQKEMLDQ